MVTRYSDSGNSDSDKLTLKRVMVMVVMVTSSRLVW